MIDKLLGIVAPHYCSGCMKPGTLLCDNCKYNIKDEPFAACIVCRGVTATNNLCRRHTLPYQQAWCVGERSDALQRLIGQYKFQYAKSAFRDIGMLVDGRLPDLPDTTIIVPVPTVRSHVRERGYDHTLLIARHIAKKRKLPLRQLIERRTNTKQRDATRSVRISQAKQAFEVNVPADSSVPYLIVDDVVTTGATVQYAAQALWDAGARVIWVAVVARQPLD